MNISGLSPEFQDDLRRMIYRNTSVRLLGGGLVLAVCLVFVFAPQYLGVIETIRTLVWPAADLEHTSPWEDNPDLVYDCSTDDFSHVLGENGFTRNPLSYYVTMDDQPGDSWVYRNSTLDDHQTHVNTFEVDGQTHLYVHREYNTLRHPIKHVRNPGQPTLDPNGTKHVLQIMDSTPAGSGMAELVSTVGTEMRAVFAETSGCSRVRPTEVRHSVPTP